MQFPQFRTLQRADHSLFLAHLLRLDRDRRKSRFGEPVGDGFLRDYVERADPEHTVVFGCPIGI